MDFIRNVAGNVTAGLVLSTEEKVIFEKIKAAIER